MQNERRDVRKRKRQDRMDRIDRLDRTETHRTTGSEDAAVLENASLCWSVTIDEMLARWCDQAKSFEWMHTESAAVFRKRALIISIATNSLTAVAGISNVMTGSTQVDGFPLAWFFGGLSVLTSIGNMIQEKLAFSSRCALHEHAAVQWGVIRRKIEEEVLLPYASRKNCSAFLRMIREDINRVSVDSSTSIPKYIRQKCYDLFSQVSNFDVPDICGQVEHTLVYRPVSVSRCSSSIAEASNAPPTMSSTSLTVPLLTSSVNNGRAQTSSDRVQEHVSVNEV